MNANTPECWSTDPNARSVLIELASDHSVLLALDHFTFSELTRERGEEQLRLVFASHEVLIRGNCLERIESAMQTGKLSFVRRLPAHVKHLIKDRHPMISEISVSEVQP